jgi:hypothetical protein
VNCLLSVANGFPIKMRQSGSNPNANPNSNQDKQRQSGLGPTDIEAGGDLGRGPARISQTQSGGLGGAPSYRVSGADRAGSSASSGMGTAMPSISTLTMSSFNSQ